MQPEPPPLPIIPILLAQKKSYSQGQQPSHFPLSLIVFKDATFNICKKQRNWETQPVSKQIDGERESSSLGRTMTMRNDWFYTQVMPIKFSVLIYI